MLNANRRKGTHSDVCLPVVGDAGPFVATMQTGQVWRQFVVVMTPLSCAGDGDVDFGDGCTAGGLIRSTDSVPAERTSMVAREVTQPAGGHLRASCVVDA